LQQLIAHTLAKNTARERPAAGQAASDQLCWRLTWTVWSCTEDITTDEFEVQCAGLPMLTTVAVGVILWLNRRRPRR